MITTLLAGSGISLTCFLSTLLVEWLRSYDATMHRWLWASRNSPACVQSFLRTYDGSASLEDATTWRHYTGLTGVHTEPRPPC